MSTNKKRTKNLGNLNALKKPEDLKKNIFTVRLNDERAKRLRASAAADVRSISNFIEQLLRANI